MLQIDSAEPRRPALVLGGGGAFGLVQAAYIQAAYELGFRPSLVVGTSVGALNGAWVALHPDEPEGLLKIWRELDRLNLVKLNPMRLVSKLFRNPVSVTTNHIVPVLIERHLAGATFADTRLDLGVVATNLSRGEKRMFRVGELGRPILASTAIPGVFEPVEIDGDLYVDGGVSASLDLASALEMGATEVFAIDLTPGPVAARPRTALGVLRQSFAILASASTKGMEDCLAQQMPVQVVRPDLTQCSPWRLDDAATAITENLRLARLSLAGLFDSHGRIVPGASAGSALECDAPSRPLSMERYFHHRVKRQAI